MDEGKLVSVDLIIGFWSKNVSLRTDCAKGFFTRRFSSPPFRKRMPMKSSGIVIDHVIVSFDVDYENHCEAHEWDDRVHPGSAEFITYATIPQALEGKMMRRAKLSLFVPDVKKKTVRKRLAIYH